tara:strand:+ start:488 stop:859 length:372 start_codon:yes stop_codon:yes gene_type:complete
MESKIFITELNHEQVDVLGDGFPDYVVYFNVRIHWGLTIYEDARKLDIVPRVDRIELFCGEDARASDKMLIIRDEFLDIVNDENCEYSFKFNFITDEDDVQNLTIKPKFVAVDIRDKVVEVIV